MTTCRWADGKVKRRFSSSLPRCLRAETQAHEGCMCTRSSTCVCARMGTRPCACLRVRAWQNLPILIQNQTILIHVLDTNLVENLHDFYFPQLPALFDNFSVDGILQSQPWRECQVFGAYEGESARTARHEVPPFPSRTPGTRRTSSISSSPDLSKRARGRAMRGVVSSARAQPQRGHPSHGRYLAACVRCRQRPLLPHLPITHTHTHTHTPSPPRYIGHTARVECKL